MKRRRVTDSVDPKPRTLVRFHFVMMVVWAAMLVPSAGRRQIRGFLRTIED